MKRLILLALLLPACFPVRRSKCVAAVSDLHLGDPRSILDDEAGRTVFVDALRNVVEQGGVRTLVLNGDVLELALASEENAWRAARELFEDLATIEKLADVVVVVGNHDHALYRDLPGSPEEKLGKLFTESKLHEELAASAGHLRITLVYPDWSLEARDGNVHFTHGHYFDPWVTPTFDGTTWENLEERNAEWWGVLHAGATDPVVRTVYRTIYHWGHHAAALLGSLSGDGPVELGDRETERVRVYVKDVIRDKEAIAIVSGHTHQGGGLEAPIDMGNRELMLYDTGSFVVGHHGRNVAPYFFLLDPKRGDRKMLKIEVPAEVEEAARDRAFATTP